MIKEKIQNDLNLLPENYKTKDIDGLIIEYVKQHLDVSELRDYVLTEQQFHRIYFHTMLKQIRSQNNRLDFIDKNLLFSDWWHTDELISLVSGADFNKAYSLAVKYVNNDDPFVRRWGYVMFISRMCRNHDNLPMILGLFHDDDHYYVQMAQAWLICELAVFFPDEILTWLPDSKLSFSITGKAIQKISDSFRISIEKKTQFKDLRKIIK